jgi:methylmalonyl-CoA mutase cobalamin-binding subunit
LREQQMTALALKPAAPHRARSAVVVLVGLERHGERPARALASSLRDFGIDAVYLGRESSVIRIAAAVAAASADSVELCLDGGGGITLLRELLAALTEIGRRGVSIVVHRIP